MCYVIQGTRDRLDTLSQLARTHAEARAAHAERMDQMEKSLRTVEETLNNGVKELKTTCAGKLHGPDRHQTCHMRNHMHASVTSMQLHGLHSCSAHASIVSVNVHGCRMVACTLQAQMTTGTCCYLCVCVCVCVCMCVCVCVCVCVPLRARQAD